MKKSAGECRWAAVLKRDCQLFLNKPGENKRVEWDAPLIKAYLRKALKDVGLTLCMALCSTEETTRINALGRCIPFMFQLE